MAKRTSHSFSKRQKELRQQKKKEDKAEKKRLKKEAGEPDGQGGAVGSGEEQ
jgi:hypothetical protein